VSYSQLRKFYDASLFGIEQSRRYFCLDFTANMDAFFERLKKETIEAKIDQGNSDVISRALNEKKCFWTVKNNNVFFWSYTVMLWNCMARKLILIQLVYIIFEWVAQIVYVRNMMIQKGTRKAKK